MNDKDIEDALRDLGKQDADYPADLHSATRAEFTTLVRTSKRDGSKCCPLMLMYVALPILTIIGIILNL